MSDRRPDPTEPDDAQQQDGSDDELDPAEARVGPDANEINSEVPWIDPTGS